jgi:hypothetical protein
MLHAITKTNIFYNPNNNLVFIFSNRYSKTIFQDIMLDIGIIRIFITGIPQVIIFQKLDPTIIINKLIIGKHKIWFSKKKLFLLVLFESISYLVIYSFIYSLQIYIFCFAYRT